MRMCEKCGKSSIGGGTRKLLRGHYNPTAWTKKRANLQWTTLLVKGKRSYVCTKCLRTLTKKAK
ncbi:MAG: 50S ribosomal protein L28 [Patescibacteria group bacterium]